MKRKKEYKFDNQDLKKLGFYDKDLLKAAGKTATLLLKEEKYSRDMLELHLAAILENPQKYQDLPDWAKLAQNVLLRKENNHFVAQTEKVFALKENYSPYSVFGEADIDQAARNQMDIAMRLPISVAGALMPDAHSGYGLPIGGVLATEIDKIIPFAVGVDIACRMCLSVFELPAEYIQKNENKLKNLLLQNTRFGTGNGFEKPLEDSLFEKDTWNSTKVIKNLMPKAIKQIGSSGTGNHFVEWGILQIVTPNNPWQLEPNRYLALLSHSGSRGFGANIAEYYSKLAMQLTKLPEHAKHLAWLDLNTEAGQEYWIAMNLAGEYASANHHHIHRRMATSLELKPLFMVENHHNFAWRETLSNGKEVMVHRKGATPASVGELGIIPASMTDKGYLVKGKGNENAIHSASHGAGRRMSRSKAFQQITKEQLSTVLQEQKVMLIGGDLDEAPMAYKNIEQVMAAQQDLVEIIGSFQPKIVRMADKETPKWRLKKGNKNDDLFSES
ncbi:MAG: RtcB family protein [Cytophagales bacterium]|nr:MAG: RtcB family protein [Cytophagales bacterium]